MRAVDIIAKKRDGLELSREEIEFFIEGFTRGDILDYQASAWAMAVVLRGMTARETYDLTQAMIASGETLDLAEVAHMPVDKHSTGGVGDKTTLVVQPIAAAAGIPLGKMSGRGLGFSGGTLDKMESIPGFKVDLTSKAFLSQIKDIGLVLCGQTANLAPADGKLYSLRDVTGTVPSIPLIASSVMCKKIAGGAKGLVLDVKAGSGAFMHSVREATRLARLMVDLGRRAGMQVVALISDMNQPLGNAVGNAIELREALDTLNAAGPDDFREHCLVVAAHLIRLGGKAGSLAEGRRIARDMLKGGKALEKFRQLVRAQGGDESYVLNPDQLPKASIVKVIPSPRQGYLAQINARDVGLAAVTLGAGRSRKGEAVDHAVGVVVHHKVGDRVKKGEPLFTIHANDKGKAEEAAAQVLAAHSFSRSEVEPLPLFYRTIRS
jgi:pyrimidine-nucleoside phosphorylase